MADYVLEAQPRTIIGKQVRQLRNQGLVPAVVYGPKTEPVQIQVPYRPLEVTLMKAGGTHLIDIQVDKQIHTVLTRYVQRHVVKGNILHVDFFAVDINQTLTAEVFIHFVGQSPAVNASIGMLMTGTNSLTIETLPTNIPEYIEVDLSGLAQIGDSIHVRDLVPGEGIIILNDPDELIARIVQPSAARAAEEEEAAATVLEPVEEEEETE